eukprot:gb/GECH01008589.1/.p1 GENE.gb/GECH01008589.1/~~gb/GECH01008589.1/.p1  ORF type:complete len:121 (+),score=36.44 gb/GECH01008589.1/:1-363(+)
MATADVENPEGTLNKRIQISSRMPLFFYVNLVKKRLKDGQVELSGLGNAINSVVSVAEITRTNELGNISDITTDMADVSGDPVRAVQKPMMHLTLTKSDKYDQMIAEQEKEKEQEKEEKK